MGSSGKYILMNDIDLSGVEWTAKKLNAGAEFNGNGYAISNLTDEKGLFDTNNGIIKNIRITNAEISGGGSIAVLVGINNGNIENCSAVGKITATDYYTGGLCGQNSGVIKNSSAKCDIDGIRDVGGLVGLSTGCIYNSFASGSVKGTDSRLGGLVGYNKGETALIENAITDSVVNNGTTTGGMVGNNSGSIKNVLVKGTVIGETHVGGIVGASSGKIENATAKVDVTLTGAAWNAAAGGLVGTNSGTIKNVMAGGEIDGTQSVGGLVGSNSGEIENVSATGNVTATANNAGGLVGQNQGTIKNASASGNVTLSGNNGGGFAGSNNGTIQYSNSTGDVINSLYYSGGFVGNTSGTIANCYSLGSVDAKGHSSGGFAGAMSSSSIINSYSKGNVNSTSSVVGGFVGRVAGTTSIIQSCYSNGNVKSNYYEVASFVGYVEKKGALDVFNSYSTGVVQTENDFYVGQYTGAFIGSRFASNANIENCYANIQQPSGVPTQQAIVNAMPLSWFEDGQNLTFLGSAYDYYYNPPELWGNKEAHPEEFTQFQVGANSGEKNTLNMNMTFRMYDFYGDVSSVESASATLDRVDAFKERLSEHRSMIGSVRNRLDSVLESQNIRLENLNSSHSTIVDTDFASETAKLTRNQILQQATSSLLSQANFMPNIALQLLS